MKVCFCRTILALLIIVFAWWNVSWAPIALTIIGAILALMAISGNKCCCQRTCEEKEKKE